MVGETNRAPFDLPEAEGELVGGFHTEYSSLKFALFFLAEYINMVTVSALATTLFLGGWRAPGRSRCGRREPGLVAVLWFVARCSLFLFFFIWLRGTLPRLRYDQFMQLGWKVLIPVASAGSCWSPRSARSTPRYDSTPAQVALYGGVGRGRADRPDLRLGPDRGPAQAATRSPRRRRSGTRWPGGHPVPPLPGQTLPALTAVATPADDGAPRARRQRHDAGTERDR